MTFNAASRLRSLKDSVPKSAVLPYASGVGGLSRRLLNIYIYICILYTICIYIYMCPHKVF